MLDIVQISYIFTTNEIIQAKRKRLQTLVRIQGHMFSCCDSIRMHARRTYLFSQKSSSNFCQM